jgi:glycosyltransferase involved in cell wall biosynthesis
MGKTPIESILAASVRTRVFVIGHPLTKTNSAFLHHGFTTKVWNLCEIYSRLGYEVIHLGVAGSSPKCSEHVDLVSEDFWQEHIGPDAHKPPAVMLSSEEAAKQAVARLHYYKTFAENAVTAIRQRVSTQYSSVVAVTIGDKLLLEALAKLDQFVIEAGIGYYPQVTSKYRVFESNAWAHLIYGKEGRTGGDYWQEAVIPNATDPTRFTYRFHKDDYFLLMGRMNEDKGIGIAIEVARRLGKRLILAGTPGPAVANLSAAHVEFRPNVSEEERCELMAGAAALFAPTRYPEPFGAVVIEASMSGTPVISTDWGAFTETVLNGLTGFRCRSLDQFVSSAQAVLAGAIDPLDCRNWALKNFSPKAVAPLWNEYFLTLLSLNSVEGWNSVTGRTGITGLRKSYPAA